MYKSPLNSKMKNLKSLALFSIFIAVMAGPVQAEIKERRTFIPVQVPLKSGEVIKRDMELVIIEDDASKEPRPVVIYGHGYPGNSQSISTGLWLYSHRKALNEFVKLGFNVVMPLRIGQGGTGGQTLEQGTCSWGSDDYAELIKNIGSQLVQAASWAKQQPFAKPDELILVGQSFGGSGAIGMSADEKSPFKLLINFSAGSGKDRAPDFPCSPEAYAERLAVYGKDSKMGMLWLYGLNDTFWGKSWPVKWMDAYKNAGGKVEFHQVDSQTLEGHNLFRNSPEVWVPIVKQYLAKNNALPR
jgi:dienelactone hydrolase